LYGPEIDKRVDGGMRERWIGKRKKRVSWNERGRGEFLGMEGGRRAFPGTEGGGRELTRIKRRRKRASVWKEEDEIF
jgi:hypothetical protein